MSSPMHQFHLVTTTTSSAPTATAAVVAASNVTSYDSPQQGITTKDNSGIHQVHHQMHHNHQDDPLSRIMTTVLSGDGDAGPFSCLSNASVMSGGTSTSAATPSSVLVASPSLVRELSDLSGSYMNPLTRTPTTPTSQSHSHHHRMTTTTSSYNDETTVVSLERPWQQAYILSQPPSSSTTMTTSGGTKRLFPSPRLPSFRPSSSSSSSRTKTAIILVEERNNQEADCVVEVVKRCESEDDENHMPTSSHPLLRHNTNQVPLVLLLMDPAKKLYEFMVLIVDISKDTVRDVLHALQKQMAQLLPSQKRTSTTKPVWKQDYDGFFQIRWQQSSQLIHILNISKYDVVPYEVWIAKPWSMSAKTTISYAEGLLTHLKSIGVIQFGPDSMPHLSPPPPPLPSIQRMHPQPTSSSSSQLPPLPPSPRMLLPRIRTDPPAILTLSEEAQLRIQHCHRIMDESFVHHHASQYITFVPPFEEYLEHHHHHHLEDSCPCPLPSTPIDPPSTDELSTSQHNESQTSTCLVQPNKHHHTTLKDDERQRSKVVIPDRNDDYQEIVVSKGLTSGKQSPQQTDGLLFRAHDADVVLFRGHEHHYDYKNEEVDEIWKEKNHRHNVTRSKPYQDHNHQYLTTDHETATNHFGGCLSVLLFGCSRARHQRRVTSSDSLVHGPWEKLKDDEITKCHNDDDAVSDTLLETYSDHEHPPPPQGRHHDWDHHHVILGDETPRDTLPPPDDPSVISESAPLLRRRCHHPSSHGRNHYHPTTKMIKWSDYHRQSMMM